MADNPNLVIKTPCGQIVTVTTKDGTVRAKLEWELGFGPKFSKQLQGTQAKLDQEVMKQLEPYMQLDTGAMIMSMRLSTIVGTGKVQVTAPYSSKMFYSSSSVGRKSGALRGPHFFTRMKADRLAYLLQFAKRSVGIK